MLTEGSGGISSFARRAWRGARWVLLFLLLAFIGLVIYRIPAAGEQQRSEQAVAFIQSQKLTLEDVDGSHLPPQPDPAQADATVAGVDANGNGIRDDVELAIFKKYPGPSNIKIRAAELQYAMAEQMFLTNVFDTATWKAIAEQDDRAYQCIASTIPRTDIQQHVNQTSVLATDVETLVFNGANRKQQRLAANEFETSFGLPPGPICDINSFSG